MDEELRKKEDEDDKQDSDFDPELEEMLEQSRKTQAPLVREIETSLFRKYSAENCWFAPKSVQRSPCIMFKLFLIVSNLEQHFGAGSARGPN